MNNESNPPTWAKDGKNWVEATAELMNQQRQEIASLREELQAAHNGTRAWIGDIQRFNVALGLVPAAHRIETLDAIADLKRDLAEARTQLTALRQWSEQAREAMEELCHDHRTPWKAKYDALLAAHPALTAALNQEKKP